MVMKIVDIIVERRGYILLVKKGDFWILPGGECEDDDCEMASLEEVVAREMNDQVACIFKKLDKPVRGISPVRGGEVEVTVYVGDISSEKMSEVKDCNAHWFSRESLSALKLSNITREVLNEYFSSNPVEDGPP